MYGGTIEGNTVGSSNQVEGHEQNDLNNDHDRGGGVCVAGGTFTMEGAATISKNTATDGGVYVGSNATFTMTGGTIGGSTTSSMKTIFRAKFKLSPRRPIKGVRGDDKNR